MDDRPASDVSPVAQVLAVFGSFAAGPLIGVILGRAFAPGSLAADAAGAFALPLAFVAGMVAWFGLGFAHAVLHLLVWLVRREPREALRARAGAIPTGYGAFVPISIAAGAAAGLVTGIAAPGSFALPFLAWILAGAAYGFALRRLAALGYLPFPDPE
jgi:hypothetical protein